MGSTEFQHVLRGSLSMEDAYRHLVDEAYYEDGHDAYNGTISTTHGVQMAPGITTPITEEEASEMYEQMLDEGTNPFGGWPEKWGAAWAIPLLPDPDFKQSETGLWRGDRKVRGWFIFGLAAC